MSAPSTIKPTRTTTPAGIPGLVDAEILAGQLVWTLGQIREHADMEWLAARSLEDALDAATLAQHCITTLQVMEGRR